MTIVTCCVAFGGAQLLCSSARSQETSANDLLQRVVDHELRDTGKGHTLWTYDRTTRKSGHELTKEVIQTRQGDLDRLISIDGRPLSNEQQQRENTRLRVLLAHPQQSKKSQRDREQDDKRAERFLSALPNATVSTYGARRSNLIELRFKPNPRFHPTSHETKVLHSMSGTILVDSTQERLAQIDGHLVNAVKFGGGLLGHLDQGGSFHVEQSEVQPGHWEVTRLIIHMRGKALFFKSISVEENDSWTHFRRVPQDFSLAQAAKKLNQTGSVGSLSSN